MIVHPGSRVGYEGAAPSLFLAGGITGCPDWQADAALWLKDYYSPIYNPRRNFDMSKTGDEAREQIRWERAHLQQAKCIFFWFCGDTVQPIVLYELGRWVASNKTLFIGVDTLYSRKFDVIEQVMLERPQQQIHETLYATTQEAIRYGYRELMWNWESMKEGGGRVRKRDPEEC